MNREQIINQLIPYNVRVNYHEEQARKYLEMFDTEELQFRLKREKDWDILRERATKITEGRYYEVGQVVKIDTTEFYNYWAVVLEINARKKLLKIMVYNDDYSVITITVSDIKTSIGTIDLDLYGLGNQRHKKEVIPVIKKAQKKYPQYFNQTNSVLEA